MMYARSVTDNVSRTLWSVIRIPMPLARRSEIIFCKSKTAMGSIPENGSSSNMKVGLMNSDRAISTRRRSPPEDGIERSGFSDRLRSQKAHHRALQNLKANPIYYASATIRLANFVGGQRMHLSCHLSPGDRRGGFSPFHQHPIIASKESQRIARNFAPFGIKNAGRFTR